MNDLILIRVSGEISQIQNVFHFQFLCGLFIYHVLIFLDNFYHTATDSAVAQYRNIDHNILLTFIFFVPTLFFCQYFHMMHTGLPLQLFDHTGDISRSLQYLYTQCQRCDSVDGNTLMDRQDIRTVLCDDLQHIRQNSRFVIHLESQRDGRSLRIVMERKDIILVLIKRTAADANCINRLLYGQNLL